MVALLYLDTSALLKRYIDEIGSVWLRDFLDSSLETAIFLTSILTAVETSSAMARRRRESRLTEEQHTLLLQAFDYDLTYKYRLAEVTYETINLARELTIRHPLRAYDAVQLASALLIKQEIVEVDATRFVFLSANQRLCDMAKLEGLVVENPTHYP